MVSETFSQNRFDFMESYKLLELTGSESENDIIHLASYDQTQSQLHSQPRKKKLKRKQRDLLRSSGTTVQYETPSKLINCCGWCSLSQLSPKPAIGSDSLSGRHPSVDRGEIFRSCLLVVTIICLCIVTGLALHLHSRLDATQHIIDKIEASGSELPAKFHESHVRLQQLEKNHSSLLLSLTSVSSDVKGITLKMNKLEISLKALEDRLAGAPQLSSLPKDLANVQDSVATFGSSLQDVQSSVKALKEEADHLHQKVDVTSNSLSTVKNDIFKLKNDTHLPPERGREGVIGEAGTPVAMALVALQNDVRELSSVVATVNASIAGRHTDDDIVQNLKVDFHDSLDKLSTEMSRLEVGFKQTCLDTFPRQISNMSADVAVIREITSQHHSEIQSLNQSIAVVKGVEKKLEGSQVQMASGVSLLKQQLQTLEEEIKKLPSSTSLKDPDGRRKREVKRWNKGFEQVLTRLKKRSP